MHVCTAKLTLMTNNGGKQILEVQNRVNLSMISVEVRERDKFDRVRQTGLGTDTMCWAQNTSLGHYKAYILNRF